MDNPFTSFESRLKIYRRVWIGALVITLILRFTFFLGGSERAHFYLFLSYMLGTWLPIILVGNFEGYRLKSYLTAHHPSRWDIFGLGILIWHFFRRDDFGDSRLKTLRLEQQRFSNLIVAMFLSYLVVFFIVNV
jgi:hypothetical protein